MGGMKTGGMDFGADSSAIKKILDGFYADFDFALKLRADPIEFPHRYSRREDVEAAAFIAASFAYGRVDLFKPAIEKVLARMGGSPFDFLVDFDPARGKMRDKNMAGDTGGSSQAGVFSDINYRFNKGADIAALMYALGETLRAEGSLEAAFMRGYNGWDGGEGRGGREGREGREERGGRDVRDSRDGGRMRYAISGFVERILGVDTTPVYGENVRPAGFLQFLPSPRGGSPCKRINMFLRWMVRDADVDFGLWRGVSRDELIIPLDVHIQRISRCLGFTQRKSNDWKAAREITAALRRLDPEDPLKYDFALAHHGISGRCRAMRDAEECGGCAFNRGRGAGCGFNPP
jgi:uncharacterized protein (TIGR02757 family)